MNVRWLGLFALVAFLLVNPVTAQDDTPVFNLAFTFLTTPEVSIKLQAPNLGRPIRGKLLTMSDGEVIVDTGTLSKRDRERGEKGQRVPFSRIESLRSSDGRFEFTPDEGFKVIAQRVIDTYPSIRVEGNVNALELDRPPRVKPKKKGDDDEAEQPGQLKDTESASEGEGNDKGPRGNMVSPKKPPSIGRQRLGGFENLKKKDKPEQDDVASTDSIDQADDPSPSNDDVSPSNEKEEYFCSNCNKKLSRSAIKKGECPDCHATFTLTQDLSPSSSGRGAFDSAGNTPTSPGGAFAPSGPPPAGQAAPAGQVASNTVVVQGGNGFSFDQVPNWAKGGIFVLVLLVGYHVVFNR